MNFSHWPKQIKLDGKNSQIINQGLSKQQEMGFTRITKVWQSNEGTNSSNDRPWSVDPNEI